MRRKLIITIIMAAIGFATVTGCSGVSVDVKGIERIELTFNADPKEAYSCVVSEKKNLKEAMKIYKDLETYQSPDIKASFEEVSYKIIYHDGKEVERIYFKIHPVADIFEAIFKSNEVIKQWEK